MKTIISFIARLLWRKKTQYIGKTSKFQLNITPSEIDTRDYVKAVMPSKMLPPLIDYSHLVTVKNQGNIGRCGSYAAANGIEMLDKLHGFKWDLPLSEDWHYWHVRQSEYMNTYPNDSGQTGRNTMAVLLKKGMAPDGIHS